MVSEIERDPTTIAAVDLGSNSFHMVIARILDDGFQVLDRIRDPVRLAAGLNGDDKLTPEAETRALESLERFSQRLRSIPGDHLRAVGTNTFRQAKGAGEFRNRAKAALGHPIEVISGQEEARLIYLGVARSQAQDSSSQLVVDIGGGSTEVILGRGLDVVDAESLDMGCVNYSQKHFPEGVLTKEALRIAETAAGVELQTVVGRFREIGWASATGASGTITSVSEILKAEGWGGPLITAEGLKQLKKALLKAERADALALEGMREDRKPVLAGGVAILSAIFKSLGLESMAVSSGSLREGVLHDLLNRIRHQDVRDQTVRRLVDRFYVDREQGLRVERTALLLWEQVKKPWGVEEDLAEKLLAWGARLHELGLVVSHAGHHKHGSYLLANADMPGFSADDQAILAALVRGHRRRLARSLFETLPAQRQEFAVRLTVLLRLAALLHRSRYLDADARLKVGNGGSLVTVTFPEGWLADHPLTLADLEQEAVYLTGIGFELKVSSARKSPSGASA